MNDTKEFTVIIGATGKQVKVNVESAGGNLVDVLNRAMREMGQPEIEVKNNNGVETLSTQVTHMAGGEVRATNDPNIPVSGGQTAIVDKRVSNG